MYPAYTQLVAKCSSPSIGDARATGCARDSKYKFVPLSSIRRAGVEPPLTNYHMDWVVLGFRWVDGWVPLTPTMCVIPPSYQALSGSYPNHQTSSSAGESQVRPPLTAYQVRVYENNSHSGGHITIALPNRIASESTSWKKSRNFYYSCQQKSCDETKLNTKSF